MKIAQVYDAIYPYSKGGAQKRVWEISKRLAARGHEVHIFGMKYWGQEEVILKDDVYLHGVCSLQERYTSGRRSVKQAIYFAYKLSRPLLRESFDIVDCQQFPYFPCFVAKLHSLTKHSRLIITWYEVWDSYWYEYLGRRGILGRVVERMVTHLSSNIIAISEATKRGLELIGVKKFISVIPTGVNGEEIEHIAAAAVESDVIFVGRLIRDKNVDLLIRTIALLRQELPNINCTIIGDGPERNVLERLTRELGLAANVNFLGFLENPDDVISHMKSAKVFAFPSTREGFGIAAVEANASGLPVVTVNHPQNAACDLILDGKNGFLCRQNEQDMATKIEAAISRKKEMEASSRDAVKKYDWERIIDAVEEAYETALHTSSR